MPRGGSPQLPDGAVPAEPMSIGEVANPPFAVLPTPGTLFKRRADRFATLAPGHALEPYLRFLSKLSEAQHAAQADGPALERPSRDALELAQKHAMPPFSLAGLDLDAALDATLMQIIKVVDVSEAPQATRTAMAAIDEAGAEGRAKLFEAVIDDEIPEDKIAEHVFAAAALQVHVARLASGLDASRLQRVADNACPACGGAPVSSMIVGWEGTHGARFCTCSICATHWHVPRIRCLACGTEKGVAYHSIDGSAGTIMGETCEACSSYVKMLHQHKDPALDPVADDVASLDLDMTLAKESWQRASVNPFLMGY